MADVKPVDDKLNVFISYSRDDLDFADQLDESLQLVGFSTSIDRHGISGGEEWQTRLGGLIRDADTVVFVLSPASAKSDICAWEVEEAARLNKRIIPVLCRALDGMVPPTALAQRNYIFFYAEPKSPGSGFGQGLRRLVAALKTDLDWLREHTRLFQRAAEWEAGRRSANRLLRASEDEDTARASAERRRLAEIAAAQEEREKAIEEREVAVGREAIAQKARTRAQRTITWGSAAAALLIIAGVSTFAIQQQRNSARQAALAEDALSQKAEADKQATLALAKTKEAEANFSEAQRQKAEAEKQASLAVAKTNEADSNFRDAQKTESYFRAEEARQAGADAVTAALLALAGLPDSTSADDTQRTRPFVNEAWHALYGARLAQRERVVLGGHTGGVTSAVFAPDGGRILTASSDGTARLWDRDGKPLATLQGHTGWVSSAVFAPDGGRILTASEDKTARLWDRDGKPLATLQGHTGLVKTVMFAPDDDRILTASDDTTARLWEAFPEPQTLVDRLKVEVPRCLTPAQRQRLFLAPTPPRWCIDMHKWPYDGTSATNP